MTIYEETFVSPFEKDTQDEAFKVLEEIRKSHPPEKGWIEICGYIEERPNGKWRAARRHKKIF